MGSDGKPGDFNGKELCSLDTCAIGK